jgi:multicomponent Na+:H+ antiporter subunit G
MSEIAAALLLAIGAAFMLLAAVGLARMPDLLTRMQAVSKAATLGTTCMVLAVAVYFGELGISARAIAVIVFVFLTTPLAAHMIARAGYFAGVPLYPGTVIDELGRDVVRGGGGRRSGAGSGSGSGGGSGNGSGDGSGSGSGDGSGSGHGSGSGPG